MIVFHIQKKKLLEECIFKKKNSQAKIITVVQGKILDVVVDLRKNSKTYGKYFSIKISFLTQIFHSLFLKTSLMDFYVYQKFVLFIINAQSIEMKIAKQQ